ncbi:MAG: hypothetical protein HY060_00125 [Proteobacteria bacterium]|nr:hypothetical protein [Pseudomonadota bacterium]
MSDEFGFPKMIRPLLGGLLGGFRPRRATAAADGDFTFDARGGRVPSDAQLAALINDGMLMLPPRYFVGYFLDLLI